MKTLQSSSPKRGLRGISSLAVLSVLTAAMITTLPMADSMAAWSQSHSSEDEGHSGAGKGKSASHDDESHENDSGKKGKGGKVDGGKSGQGGNPDAGGAGGKNQDATENVGKRPAWAKEGIPEVELGRLNVARSPDQVLSRAYTEALATYSPQMAEFYKLSVSGMVEQLSLNWDNVAIIDSPLQNLAMLKETLKGTQVLGNVNSADTLMAAFLGTASDKTIPISADTVIAITTILGTPVSGSAATKLAQEAEKIRVAILAGHG